MRRLALGLIMTGVLTAGCASIPTGGPVTEVSDDSGFGQSTVRYSPAPPAEGAAPADIVRGFLDAQLAYPASSRAAAAFLTPQAMKSWQRQDGVTVYRQDEVSTAPLDGRTRAEASDTAQVTLTETGRLDERGRYSAGRGTRTRDYRLQQVDGEWRIANPQPGLMVTDKFFADYFRPFNVYFFDRPARRLTAQPVHLLVDDGLAAALMTSLSRGSNSDLVRTFVPSADELRATVSVADGSAEVGFTDGPARKAGDDERLSAQIIWTLRQVPGVADARISVGSTSLAPRGRADQPITSWSEYGPSLDPGRTYALRDDQVVEIDGGEIAPIVGPWGRSATGAAGVAVTEDRVALLSRDRRTVTVAPRDDGASRTLTGERFLDPVSDADGNLWLVEPGARIRVVGQGVREVQAGELAGLDLRSIDLSPDGSQYVITSGSAEGGDVRVGRIIRNRDDQITGLARPRRIDVGGLVPRSAVWSDDVRISFLADGSAGVQVQTALVDGSTVSGGSTGGRALLPDVDAARLVVETGNEPAAYTTDARGRLWYLGAGGSWRLIDSSRILSLDHDR